MEHGLELNEDREEAGGDKVAASHRASYLLEFGTWKATCRTCGWTVRDAQRRQAASRFRMHIRDARLIDLSDPAGLEAGLVAMGIDPAGPEPRPAAPERAARYAEPDALLWGVRPTADETASPRRMRLNG